MRTFGWKWSLERRYFEVSLAGWRRGLTWKLSRAWILLENWGLTHGGEVLWVLELSDELIVVLKEVCWDARATQEVGERWFQLSARGSEAAA